MPVDPAFLDAVNTLQRIAAHLLVEGEPQYRFDFKPMPTPGVTDTVLTLDGQKLHYYNQQETWRALTWPSNDPQSLGTRLQWQTETAGTNKSFEFSGRWGLVRMLERAGVEPVDNATYQLTWRAAPDTQAAKLVQTAKPASGAASAGRLMGADGEGNRIATATATAAAVDVDVGVGVGADHGADLRDLDSLTPHAPLTPASRDLAYPLSYLMRTDVGKGPLELLALRGFVLPARIFVGKGKVPVATSGAALSNTGFR